MRFLTNFRKALDSIPGAPEPEFFVYCQICQVGWYITDANQLPDEEVDIPGLIHKKCGLELDWETS